MCQAIQECRGHLCIAEDLRPVREAEVGCDDDAGALIEFAEQVEEKRATRRAERQVAEFIQMRTPVEYCTT